MKKYVQAIISGIAILFFVTGCASPTIKVTRLNSGPNSSIPNSINIYEYGEAGPTSYKVLGVVNAVNQALSKAAEEGVRSEAALLGANALIGFSPRLCADAKRQYSWVNSLAVCTLPNGQSIPAHQTDCIVAVPHILIDKDFATGNLAKKLDKKVRELVQHYLATKGYYSFVVEEQTPNSFEDHTLIMDTIGVAQSGIPAADLVLCIRLVRATTSTIGVAGSSTMTLQLSLYSKSKKKIVWENEGSGKVTTGIILNAFTPSTKKVWAVGEALKAAVSSLPDISTKTITPSE